MKQEEKSKEINNEKKLKAKRKISVITIIMLVFLVFVTSTITMNVIKNKLFYNDSDLVTVKIQVSVVGNIDNEFEEGMKNLNVYARNPYTNEELSKLVFLEKRKESVTTRSNKSRDRVLHISIR